MENVLPVPLDEFTLMVGAMLRVSQRHLEENISLPGCYRTAAIETGFQRYFCGAVPEWYEAGFLRATSFLKLYCLGGLFGCEDPEIYNNFLAAAAYCNCCPVHGLDHVHLLYTAGTHFHLGETHRMVSAAPKYIQ